MVTKCVNRFSEPLKNIHAHGVSILLTDFKKKGCSFYILITIDLLCKRICHVLMWKKHMDSKRMLL